MSFINRREEIYSFKNNYEKNAQNNISQVYIIKANHGVGKSEFIREVSKYFSYFPLDIYQSDDVELSTFKRLVLELDKVSGEYEYCDFRTFYGRKTRNAKAIQLFLKITALFGQAFIRSNESEVELTSLVDNPIQYENFILKAQTENMFEYAKYVLSKKCMHIVFHHASNIDSGSLDLLSKLITASTGSVFIFESNDEKDSSRIEHYLKNSHNIFLKTYSLSKLSNEHIQTYIQQLLQDLKIQSNKLDSNILTESIEKGDLAEISSILKDFNDRLQKDTSAKLRSTKQILESLPEKEIICLILIDYANRKLNVSELNEIMGELENSSDAMVLDKLLEKKMIEKSNDCMLLLPFVYQIVNLKEFMPSLKYAVSSALIKNLNTKLSQNYNSRYIDILVEYYLNNNLFYQLRSLLLKISQRLKDFHTQYERIEYFKIIHEKRQELCEFDESYAIEFAQIAYDANLYFEAYDFINLIYSDNSNDNVVYLKALILNRCEDFEESINYVKSKLKKLNKQSSLYFKLSLVLMMNLIQLEEREDAVIIFNELISYTKEPLYLYLIRLSNVFYNDLKERLAVVESITEDFYKTNDNEFSGLHAIYLAYLYTLTHQPELAEKSLSESRDYFGDNLIYNHMILHNEASIKFHSRKIDEDIPILLNSAKITAYDEYDKFAINNNLLVYYILSDKMSSLECQKIALELEGMLCHTNFKRFLDKIYYNLYHYYLKMFNNEKSDYFKTKLLLSGGDIDSNYKYKLMYETSWKLPIRTKSLDS
ncbi:MAG: hypothetical protein NC489_42190 [Ruminococcus flavefaciens]|nr:hypothetical protein [Ruminococcus flavefaciens]